MWPGSCTVGGGDEAEEAQAEAGRGEGGFDCGLFEESGKVQGQVHDQRHHECAEGHGRLVGAAGMLGQQSFEMDARTEAQSVWAFA